MDQKLFVIVDDDTKVFVRIPISSLDSVTVGEIIELQVRPFVPPGILIFQDATGTKVSPDQTWIEFTRYLHDEIVLVRLDWEDWDLPRTIEEKLFDDTLYKAYCDAEISIKERFKSIDGFRNVGLGWNGDDKNPRVGINSLAGIVVSIDIDKADRFLSICGCEFPYIYSTPMGSWQVRLYKRHDFILTYL